MYYPKSQIQSRYTNGGEFIQVIDRQEYVGPYTQTSSGNAFAGTLQNPILLQRVNPEVTEQGLEPVAEWTVNETGYRVNTEAGLLPKNSRPQPTQDNIDSGVFPRFFVEKKNEKIIFEVARDQFDLISNRSNRIQWQLYTPHRIDWVITGDRNQAFNDNRNAARNLGIESFFKGDFLRYFVDTSSL